MFEKYFYLHVWCDPLSEKHLLFCKSFSDIARLISCESWRPSQWNNLALCVAEPATALTFGGSSFLIQMGKRENRHLRYYLSQVGIFPRGFLFKVKKTWKEWSRVLHFIIVQGRVWRVKSNIVDYCQSIVKGKESTELLTKGENFDNHKYICTTFIMY